jgi:hypothetical protein
LDTLFCALTDNFVVVFSAVLFFQCLPISDYIVDTISLHGS